MENKAHDIKWFIDRIGKRVFRDKNFCDCKICLKVHKEGLIILDKTHAIYLHNIQEETEIRYYEDIT